MVQHHRCLPYPMTLPRTSIPPARRRDTLVPLYLAMFTVPHPGRLRLYPRGCHKGQTIHYLIHLLQLWVGLLSLTAILRIAHRHLQGLHLTHILIGSHQTHTRRTAQTLTHLIQVEILTHNLVLLLRLPLRFRLDLRRLTSHLRGHPRIPPDPGQGPPLCIRPRRLCLLWFVPLLYIPQRRPLLPIPVRQQSCIHQRYPLHSCLSRHLMGTCQTTHLIQPILEVMALDIHLVPQ